MRIRRETLAGWLFIAPAVIGFVLFYALPTLRAFQISFTDWSLLTPAKFIGMANHLEWISDRRFWKSVGVTALYVLYNIPLQTGLALLLAVGLDRFGRSVAFRAVMVAPFLVSNVIAAAVWFWMLDPVLGFGNTVLEWMGLGRHAFFSDGTLALPTIAVINIWRHVGFNALIFYTGLQAIPRHLYEAGHLEGASGWQAFRHITWPLLRPITVFIVATSIIGSFQIFDTIAVTTQGGPGTSTQTVMWYIYQTAFGSLRMGYASAMSCALFFGLVAITLIQLRTMRAGESDLE